MNDAKQPSLTVESGQAKTRLDAFLARAEPGVSRSAWKALILEGLVTVNGAAAKPNHKVKAGEVVAWTIPEEAPAEPVPEEIPLDILYEDGALLALNKPPGLVVHPAVGNASGTLLHGLLYHDPAFQSLERAGIVHRLDKDTSGVMVVAKTEAAMAHLQAQFKGRETEKQYAALVWGEPPVRGRIETRIGRHPVHRKKQAVLKKEGREAITNYERVEQFAACALMKVGIETGRTHQIRVHMAHLHHPIVGDTTYGRGRKSKLPIEPARQMLHAARLSLNHPETGKRLSFEAPLFEDMKRLLDALRASCG